MKLKVMILLAGAGTRLQPYSDKAFPKVLFPFLGKPLFCYHIEEFLKQGILEFIFVCNLENRKKVEDIVYKHHPNILAHFTVQKKQIGPANAVYLGTKYVGRNDYFILKYADRIDPPSKARLILRLFREEPCDGVIFLNKVKDFQRFGIARFQGKELLEIVEKPTTSPPSYLAWRGIAILRADVFRRGYEQDRRNKMKKEVAPPEYVLRAGGKLNYKISDYNKIDLGYPWDILILNKYLLKRFSGKQESKHIGRNVVISPKSYIGPKTVLEDGVKIGPYTSLDNVKVGKRSVIQGSYIMSGAQIGVNSKIKESVIGRGVKIGSGFKTQIHSKNNLQVFSRGEYKIPPQKTLGCFLGHNVKIAPNLYSKAGKVVYSDKRVNNNIVHDIVPQKAIFFDADNTLYKSRKAAYPADFAAIRYLARGTKHKPQDLYSHWLQNIVARLKQSKSPQKRHRRYSYRKLIEKYDLEKSADRAFSIFRSKLIKNLKLAPYLIQTLNRLKDYQKVIISEDSKDLINFKLRKLDIKKYFDLVVSAQNIGKMKPDKNYFQFALEKIRTLPCEAVMIGDDWKKDLKLAYQLGMRTVIFGKEDKRAHGSLRDFRKLPRLLESI